MHACDNCCRSGAWFVHVRMLSASCVTRVFGSVVLSVFCACTYLYQVHLHAITCSFVYVCLSYYSLEMYLFCLQ